MSATLTAPLAAAAASVAFLASAAHPAPAPDARVELELAAVLPMPQGPAGLLVLRERKTGTLLPVLVPDGTALDATSSRKGHAIADAGLLGRAIEALGARVQEVEIDRAEEATGATRVRLRQGTHDVEIPARPSEAVALAVAAGARILTTRKLLDASGLTPDELEAASRKAAKDEETDL